MTCAGTRPDQPMLVEWRKKGDVGAFAGLHAPPFAPTEKMGVLLEGKPSCEDAHMLEFHLRNPSFVHLLLRTFAYGG